MTLYYRLQIARVDRPVMGSRTGRMRCTTCGQWVGIRVMSVAVCRAWKAMEAVLVAAAVAGLVGVIAVVASLPAEGVPDWQIGLVAAVAVALILIGGVAVLALLAEDGVRLYPWRLTGPHAARPFRRAARSPTPPERLTDDGGAVVFDQPAPPPA